MEVEPYGRATFLVRAHGDTFTVDLLVNEGNGACDCVRYLAQIKPALELAKEDGSFVPGKRFQCPHISEAREFLLALFLERLAQRYTDNENAP